MSSFCHRDSHSPHASLVTSLLSKLFQSQIVGLIPLVKAKGSGAAAAADILFRMRREAGGSAAGLDGEGGAGGGASATAAAMAGRGGQGGGAVQALVILDREVDLVTPLLTPFTYEALVDEVGYGEYPRRSVIVSFIHNLVPYSFRYPQPLGVLTFFVPPPPPPSFLFLSAYLSIILFQVLRISSGMVEVVLSSEGGGGGGADGPPSKSKVALNGSDSESPLACAAGRLLLGLWTLSPLSCLLASPPSV